MHLDTERAVTALMTVAIAGVGPAGGFGAIGTFCDGAPLTSDWLDRRSPVHLVTVAINKTETKEKECVMDWNRLEGSWKQFRGNVKEKWGRLTDDDLDVINGRQDQLEGKIQERYGLAKDQAKKDVDAWFKSLP